MALSLDGEGTANAGAGTSVSVPLTTTTGSGVIVVLYIGNAAPAASNPVTGAGLSFTNRFSTSSGGNFFAEYTAPYTSNFSGNITVTASASTFLTSLAFGIGGAATSSFFDANGSLPGTAGSGNTTISTSNANDFIFGFNVNNAGAPGAPWTLIDATAQSNFLQASYRIESTTQTNITYPATGGGGMDAIVLASASSFLAAWARGSNLPVIGTGDY